MMHYDFPLRFGIVGCGTISPTHADAIVSIPDAKLTCCSDIDFSRAQSFGSKYSLSLEHIHSSLLSFLDDPELDAVGICAPSGIHAEIAIQALERGKAVIVEKPMDISVDSCDRMIKAQTKSGLPLAVIFQHRFDRSSITARKLIENGAIGKIILVDAQIKWRRTQEYYDSGDWRGTWELDGGGALMNQGIHTLDLMRWLAGPIKSVYAVSKTAAHKRIDVEDVLCATLSFKNGAIGNLMASTAAYPGFPASLSLHGEDGSIVISGDELTSVETVRPIDIKIGKIAEHAMQVAQGGTKMAEALKDEPNSTQILETTEPTRWGDSHRAEYIDFIQAIRNGQTPSIDGAQGRNAVELVCAIYESARKGKVVTL
jgi:predicted dehydrogenase